MMNYVPPFEVVKRMAMPTMIKGKSYATLPYDEFVKLVKLLLRGVEVDENWYLKTYPDVEEAIKVGTFRSAKHHFVEEGYFEGRRPGEMNFDEAWYVATYEDVAASIEIGEIHSAEEHFLMHGYTEGRLPSEY